MATFTSGFNYPTGQLTASMQADALSGSPGFDTGTGGLLNAILAEKRRQQALAMDAQRQAKLDAERQAAMARQESARQQGNAALAMQQGDPYTQMQRARNVFGRDYSNFAGAIGGPHATNYQRAMRETIAPMSIGFGKLPQYTGITDLVNASSGASAAAVEQAGANQRSKDLNARLQADALRR